MRKLYMVLGWNAASYAQVCVRTLLERVGEPVSLTLITDGVEDVQRYGELLATIPQHGHHVSVLGERDVDVVAADRLARFPHARALRDGHPCWRKVTDPALLAGDDGEAVILDPDLYFPNQFRFDPAPPRGVALMWQPPSCLYPAAAVETAFALGTPLAHHVDIGVAMLRLPLDWAWLDDFCQRFVPARFARFMHIEAILWAAYGMHAGGGYLDPGHYRCYRHLLWKRLALKARTSELWLLQREPFAELKVYHAGGWPKQWLARAEEAGVFPAPQPRFQERPLLPFVRYEPAEERRKQQLRQLARLPLARGLFSGA